MLSEPIVHYKKDCDMMSEEGIGKGDEVLRTHRPLQEGLRHLYIFEYYISQFSEPIVHYKKDCDTQLLP